MRTRFEALLVAWLVLAPAVRATPPTYPCYQPGQAPVLDGRVEDDPAWSAIPAVTGFSRLGDGYTLAKQTVLRVCWDAEALYVAVVCEEPDAAKLAPKMRDGGPFWEEDGIELFVQPGPSGTVLQFGITAFGAKGAWEGSPDFTKYQACAGSAPGAYTLEVRVPFPVLRATPTVGDAWRGNVCRNIFTTASGGDKFTSWAPLQARFLEPENFATIAFRGPTPDTARAAAAGEDLNRVYRKHLTGELRAAVGQGKEYAKGLAEASHDPRFGARAAELEARWRQAKATLRAADAAPTVEMRRSLADVNVLVRQSYDLVYAYRIATVLGDE